MEIKKSNLYATDIVKSNPIAYNVDNAFYCVIYNNTGFEVEINDRFFGKVKIVPGIPIQIFGFPQFPFDLAFTAKFNNAAPDSDYITVISNSIGKTV